jgi:hypothetical protein
MTERRLVQKDVMLGVLREMEPPQEHIGERFLPMQEVANDDVIWDAVKGMTSGLAPARAMDAEAEIAVRDEVIGTGKASIIDWSVKDRWNASDVARYREVTEFAGADALPRSVQAITADWQAKMARATLKRRRQLDNRLEWLRWRAIQDNLSYNDGKVSFATTYGIPSDQKAVVPSVTWNNYSTSDPIGNLMAWKELVRNRTGVELREAVVSRKVLYAAMLNANFAQLWAGANPFYQLNNSFGLQQATERLQQATDINFTVFDASYRTRAFGSTTITNTRFTDERDIYLFPGSDEITSYSGGNNGLGLGNVLTSPHPEGNWASGFYEWEQERRDPWGLDQGSGIKAFPVLWAPEILFSARVLP